MIQAQILADSKHRGSRLTTFHLFYPRMFHSELLTHAGFARNSSSTRATPMFKQLEEAATLGNNAVEYWGKMQRGQQARECLNEEAAAEALSLWRHANNEARYYANRMVDLGVHKQIAGRMVEPYAHIHVVVTAEEKMLRNFFALRAQSEAMPEFQILAYRMLDLWLRNTPRELHGGEWHIPFITEVEKTIYSVQDQLRISVARCCWVSTRRHDREKFEVNDAFVRHDESARDGHWSSFEHQAQALGGGAFSTNPGKFGKEWTQYRKSFPTECRWLSDDELLVRLENRPEWVTL